MYKVAEIADYFEKKVPSAMKMDFDNVGFLAGNSGWDVGRVLVSLDITGEVIEEAKGLGAQLILSHHPLFFQLKSASDRTPEGHRLVSLLSSGIAAICLHTNLDCACGGVNDALMARLGIDVSGILEPEQALPDGTVYGCGRWGELAEATDMPHFLGKVKDALSANGLRYHDAKIPVKRVAVCGGSGGSMLGDAVARGCDTLVTADVKYDQFLFAREEGINLIDADHFCTENVVVPVLADMLGEAFPELDVHISKRHCQTACFF